jgi:hypothetical protein
MRRARDAEAGGLGGSEANDEAQPYGAASALAWAVAWPADTRLH